MNNMIILIYILSVYSCFTIGHGCRNEIFCHGRLLHTIQMAGIYKDSKTFIDMKILKSEKETIHNFDLMMNITNNTPTKANIKEFIAANFDENSSEFITWEPIDWNEKPDIINRIVEPKYKNWVTDLNLLWKFLGRKIKDHVKENPELYSIIYVPNPVIVPGGRFREFYYWDSYWIMKGLLVCNMVNTVKGMLENFMQIVNVYGHIPNGGRIYYTMRSQPPLLLPMVKLYYDTTKDISFLKQYINTMETEFQFWIKNRTVVIPKDNKNYTLCRYKESSIGPRPESYKEDYEMGMAFSDKEDKNIFYSNLKSAAESGWDFSSRWFILNGTNKGNLTHIKTANIVPVDLNAFIHWNALILSSFYKDLSNTNKTIYYKKKASEWLNSIENILWDENVGSWLDFDILNSIKRKYFYASNLVPLWTGSYYKNKTEYYTEKVLKYINLAKVINQGGIHTSLQNSNQQWDWPNAWSPLQHMVIVGLYELNNTHAQQLALDIAKKWIKSNWLFYNQTHKMLEKYNAVIPGGHGGGGEYEIQMGFGWTNGVILDLLDRYGKYIVFNEEPLKVRGAH